MWNTWSSKCVTYSDVQGVLGLKLHDGREGGREGGGKEGRKDGGGCIEKGAKEGGKDWDERKKEFMGRSIKLGRKLA